MTAPTICLVMIVKNEAAILERCLRSVEGLVSHWVICDTGSTDNTQDVIRSILHDIPGELHQDTWINFAHNRTLSLQRARGKADYHLLIDADMVLNVHGKIPFLTADAYLLRFTGWCDYSVARLVSDRHSWIYRGVTHEYVASDTATSFAKLPELTITHYEDGSSRKDKYQRDIALLEQAVLDEPENPRYAYYLAQSYRDVGRAADAMEWYQKRALMPGWQEETWHAAYQVGKMQTALHADWRAVLYTYLQAYSVRPTRLEPIYHIANFYRERGQYSLAYHFARLVTEVPYPDDVLFVERDIYEFLLPIEYALCCQGTGRFAEAILTHDRILGVENLPAACRDSSIQNRELCRRGSTSASGAAVRVAEPLQQLKQSIGQP